MGLEQVNFQVIDTYLHVINLRRPYTEVVSWKYFFATAEFDTGTKNLENSNYRNG